jgi:hypothetical protein
MKGGRRRTTWKPAWKSGRTTVIRIPEVLVPKLLGIARHLDDGGEVTCHVGSNKRPSAPSSSPEVPQATGKKKLSRHERELLEEANKRREIFFESMRRQWEELFPSKPFPEADAESLYQRFLAGELQGMERVGRGDKIPLPSLSSWMSSVFWELKTMHERT